MTPEGREYKRDVIIETTARLMFPLILLFGLYVMIGTGGTGGGFQGGTILAAAFILYITVFGHEKGREKMPESINVFFKSFGLFLYNGAGWICILFSLGTAQWLNMPAFWPVTDFVGVPASRSFLVGYMISVGIGLTVMASFVSQFFDLAWKEEDEMEGDGR
ncbi:MAG TPA: MnhB domain-containing protein [Methanothrix sp.]|nr:MnhB domain-containing protein [Methanothrix sp.]HQE88040.1 MnhB domain-containing protein [Methanothrix sp.]HQI68320.1 MnhB domain-containing protein [Methanothrix sp.]HRS85401.1 MnhB domain-containing protein [Methanothrix sp.]HRT17394.1 MnhB domain-containing protein [Methanothrix sp.]